MTVVPTSIYRLMFTFGRRKKLAIRRRSPIVRRTITSVCIDHYARTVSEWSKDNTVSFGLRDMIRRFRDCLGR